jgi:hypothetical protein
LDVEGLPAQLHHGFEGRLQRRVRDGRRFGQPLGLSVRPGRYRTR